MPSGTSTMPRAVNVPPGRISPAPMRTRSAAVRGLASGSRMRAGAAALLMRQRRSSFGCRGGWTGGWHGRPPALHQIRLGGFEGACLALDQALCLIGSHALRLGNETGDTAEVERHERGNELLQRHGSSVIGNGRVIHDARPQVV